MGMFVMKRRVTAQFIQIVSMIWLHLNANNAIMHLPIQMDTVMVAGIRGMVISKHMQRRKPVKTLAKTVQIPERLICTMAPISVLFANTRLL